MIAATEKFSAEFMAAKLFTIYYFDPTLPVHVANLKLCWKTDLTQ